MDSFKAAPLLIVGALLLPAVAGAGTVIETTSDDNDASTIYVSGDKVRMEGGAKAAGVTVFDAAAEEMIFIDHGAQEYQRVGKEEMRQIAQQVERMREQMERQLENMPEEQRQQMREQMEQMMPGSEPPSEIRVERGDSTTTAGIECLEATVHLDGEPSHSVCVASAENLGLSPDGYQTMDRMFAFFAEMTAGMSEGSKELGPRTTARVMDELDGVPIRSQAIADGGSWMVTGVRNTDIGPEHFRVPAGYREVDPFAQGSQ